MILTMPTRSISHELHESRIYCDHMWQENFRDGSRLLTCRDPLHHPLQLPPRLQEAILKVRTRTAELYLAKGSGHVVHSLLEQLDISPRFFIMGAEGASDPENNEPMLCLAQGAIAERVLPLLLHQSTLKKPNIPKMLHDFLRLPEAEQVAREQKVKKLVLRKLRGYAQQQAL